MKAIFGLRLFAACSAFALSAATSSGETTLQLDIGFGIRFVPPALVTVPQGEYLRIIAPSFGPVQWMKNGQPIPGATDSSLFFLSVTPGDTGTYVGQYTDMSMAGRSTQALVLSVGPVQRLLNLSARGAVGGGEKTFVTGFVVGGPGEKKIILRAVGPSLAGFGVREPLARPVITIYDRDGKPYQSGYFYATVVGGLTYETDLANSLTKAGAFPLPSGNRDAVELRPFSPGAYTVHVTSADGSPGIVLLEIYEVP